MDGNRPPHVDEVPTRRRHGRRFWRRWLLCGAACVGALAAEFEAPPNGILESAPAAAATWTSPLAPLTSPDVGSHCAAGLGAHDLSDLFAGGLGPFEGADYQRAVRLPDDRVLWTFQDAFIDGRLVHNAAMVQSGRCFTLLNDGVREFLLEGRTAPMSRWHWILGGEVGTTGSRVHLFVVEMVETGGSYLEAPRPNVLRRVVLDAQTFSVIRSVVLPSTGLDLYGWSVTSDREFTYLYSHCYRQFGFDTWLGYHLCSEFVKVARVPRGRLFDPPRYWNGSRWVSDYREAVPVIDASFVGSHNNPAQISFDGEVFALVEKPEDWWGRNVVFGVAQSPQGPFRRVAGPAEPLLCAKDLCNTYFAAWVPWTDDGHRIWSISHNWWSTSTSSSAETADGEPTTRRVPKGRNVAVAARLAVDSYPSELYRPTFHSIDLPSCAGRTATIVGSPGDDRIIGTPVGDVIVALDGDDTVSGRDGDDVLCLGPGDDVARLGNGDDVVYGKQGRDTVYGGIGADVVYGGGGADTLDGRRGNDTIYGGLGNDTLYGGPRRDTLYGGRGRDTLHGDDGRDTLYGEEGSDTLYGKGGDDTLLGGPHGDVLRGGDGNDTLYGKGGDDTLLGGPHGDVLRGGDGNDTLYGRGGDDTLLGGPLDDHLDGGRDIDLCRGHDGTDTGVRCETIFGIP